MNMGDSGLNPVLGRMDDEDCFGFHSEYYVDPEWRKKGRHNTDGYNGGGYLRKGYTFYSKYRDDIYFIPYSSGCCIIKSNVKQKTARAIKLDTKRVFERSDDYIAVNRQGYFIYNAKMVTLFGFDGREIYTHKLGKKDSVECVYIYDDKVIYSETKQAAMSTQIYCVNMLTHEKRLVWGTQKNDSMFDKHLRDSYRQEWGAELPISQAPSNIGDISCQFLYANNHHVIAGYTRNNGNQISYIICVDLANHQWCVLDCFARPAKETKVPLPSWNERHICSFNMLDDTMWVKTSDKDIRLVHTDIQRVAQLRGKYSVGWKLCAMEATSSNDSSVRACYYYFDGKLAFVPDYWSLYRLKQNGESKEIYHHFYQTNEFWCFDDVYLIPNEHNEHCFRNIATGDIEYGELGEFGLCGEEFKKLLQNAEQPQLKAASESKKEESSGYTEPDSSADDSAIWAMAKKVLDDALSMDTSGYHYSEDQIESLLQTAYELIQKQLYGTAPGDEPLSQKGKEAGRGAVGGSRLSLAEFRRNAPSMPDFRDRLLSYRKSLPNSWDYNAFVGILLGVGGPKHGDAACMNFAIGQGDNGKNTKITLETKGLMPIFEKYKSKKVDETILLSDVEDEIIAIVPEYAPIRQKLHEIIGG